MKQLGIILSLLTLAGCAVTAPPQSELSKANFGELPVNYQELIKNDMPQRLKDPYSAQYEFSSPYKAWCQSGFSFYYGWLVPITINAKNSYGGYTGKQPKAYMINNGAARDFTAPYQTGGCGKA